MKIFSPAITALAFIFMSLSACGSGEAATPVNADAPSLSQELPPLTGDDIWKLDISESTLKFKANYNGDFIGEFKNFDAAIKLDVDNLDEAKIYAVIGLDSASAKDGDVTQNLPTEPWFHTSKFPLAVYTSDSISRAGSDTYVANGQLSIKGIERPVSLSFTLDIDGNVAKASGTAKLSRETFKIGTGPDFDDESWVKFPVTVMLDITANQ